MLMGPLLVKIWDRKVDGEVDRDKEREREREIAREWRRERKRGERKNCEIEKGGKREIERVVVG